MSVAVVYLIFQSVWN